jgi:predicted RND superfamily exporter protein
VEALILVIIVVFIFLQGWRATLIPLCAVPVALVSTFALFPLLGFSVNTLSLLGLVLAIGLVVDDAIVVVEAVEHHIELGLPPKDATLKAMEEVSSPVAAIAIISRVGNRLRQVWDGKQLVLFRGRDSSCVRQESGPAFVPLNSPHGITRQHD